MAKLTLKVKKIAFKHPKTKQPGFVARVLTNGTETFDEICEIAGMNTTYAQEEIVLALGTVISLHNEFYNIPADEPKGEESEDGKKTPEHPRPLSAVRG